MTKNISIIGLGKMGKNLALNLIDHDWKVVGFNRTESVTRELEGDGIIGTYTYQELINKTPTPRLVWLMTSHQAVDQILDEIAPLLKPGDLVIDGGNSYYKDSIKRANRLSESQIKFLDVGVSGGPAGARSGACCMVGGVESAFSEVEKLFQDISVENGYAYLGKSGAGHFTKMVHNGIEYGMMQAIGEGFDVLKNSEFDLDLEKVVGVYRNGSVIESRLIDWLGSAYQKHGQSLEMISSSVEHSGEGEWTVKTAKELGIDVEVIEKSLEFRKKSANKPTYTGKVVSALRGEFGQHKVNKE